MTRTRSCASTTEVPNNTFVHFSDREAATFGINDDNAWVVTDGGPNWPTLPSEEQLAAALAHLERHGPMMPVAAARESTNPRDVSPTAALR